MNNYENYIIILFYTFFLNLFFSKINFLKDKKKAFKHKNFIKDKSSPPFSGGVIFLITLTIFIPNEYYLLKFYFSLIFLIGFFSDLNVFKSPNLRFVYQFFVVLIFVIFSNTFIGSVRIDFFDKLLEFYIFKIFFTIFCILILINGSNFIDGLNGLVLGYYSIIVFVILHTYENSVLYLIITSNTYI